jgi:hypothetical protein
MAIVVVGGTAKNVGKTRLMCLLISSFRQHNWTAVKITTHPHRSTQNQPWTVLEETDRSGGTDTSKFLAAGASRAQLCETTSENMQPLVSSLQRGWSGQNVIVESNSVVEFVRPDLYLGVLDSVQKPWKDSAERFFPRAHALVCWERELRYELPKAIAGKPVFTLLQDIEGFLDYTKHAFTQDQK